MAVKADRTRAVAEDSALDVLANEWDISRAKLFRTVVDDDGAREAIRALLEGELEPGAALSIIRMADVGDSPAAADIVER